MDDSTKLLIEALNKNIEIIRREILCKIDDLNLHNSENFNDIKTRLSKIENNLSNFVKIEDCEKKENNIAIKEEFSFKKTSIIVTAISGGLGSICSILTSLFANGILKI